MKNKIFILLTILNLLIASCGNVKAEVGYQLQIIHGYTCITATNVLWCQ